MDTIKWFFSSFKWMLRWMKITIKRDPQVAVAILSILFVCVCLAVGSYLYCDFKERERKNEKREQEIRSEQGKTGKAYQDEVVHLRAELLAAQNDLIKDFINPRSSPELNNALKQAVESVNKLIAPQVFHA